MGTALFRGERRSGEALRGQAGKGEPLCKPWYLEGGEVPGGVKRSRARSAVHSASHPGPSPPILPRPALLGWWRVAVKRGPGSLWQLIYPGTTRALGAQVGSQSLRAEVERLWSPRRQSRVGSGGWFGLGLGREAGEHARCLSWNCGHTGAALGSTPSFPVKVHTQEQRPFPVLLHCRTPRAAELGLESWMQGTEGAGGRSGERHVLVPVPSKRR